MAPRERLELSAALFERSFDESRPLLVDEDIERDERRRRFGGELADPALRGMDPEEQVVEGKPVTHGDDDLAVEDELPRGETEKSLQHFREIAPERLAALRLQIHARSVT